MSYIADLPDITLIAQFQGIGNVSIGDMVRSGFTMQSGSLQPSLTGLVADPGELRTVVENFDRSFDPTFADGAYFPYVIPGVKLQLICGWDGTDHQMFLGRTDGFTQAYTNLGHDQTVPLLARDGVTDISTSKLTRTRFPRQLTGARINAILDAIGWGGTRSIDPGTAYVPRIRGDSSAGNPWSMISDAVAAEWGYGYIVAGEFVFQDRNGLAADSSFSTPVAIFGDAPDIDPTELPYVGDLELPYDLSRLVNDASLSYNSHNRIAHAEDLTSQDAWGASNWQQNIPMSSGPLARSYVAHLVHQQSTPTMRVSTLTIKPQEQPADLWPIVLALRPGQMFTAKKTPIGGGDRITRDIFVRGFSHALLDGEWTTTVAFDDANLISVVQYYDDGTTYNGESNYAF